MKAKVNWSENMCFWGYGDSKHNVMMDTIEQFGGNNRASTPKELILIGLGGCTAMDAISILKKMKISVADFSIDLEANLTNEHPKVFETINIIFSFIGKNLENKRTNIEKAVKLSQEKYCGVSAMLAKTAKIDYKVILKELE